MTQIISIRFRQSGRTYMFSPDGLDIKKGMHVLVETMHGQEYGEAVTDVREIDDELVTQPLKPVIRIATPSDDTVFEENCRREEEAFVICRDEVEKFGLEMKLINAEYTFDMSKLLIYFVAENRIDFRELVKSLASIFRTRIELRQVGSRDQARTVGGLGICGRVICCASAMNDFQPVSIKMAKTQGFSLSPSKISGTCGRLMCCLKYEQDAYEDAMKRVPPEGSLVETPAGKGIVTEANYLRETVKVSFDTGGETAEIQQFDASEVKNIGRRKKGQGGQTNMSPEEEAELKKITE
ncbi:MAG: stage 0 sporulation family protein [Clostridia bacterium]|nr:stage 0 sporulation family protein [Clostridia bacterium]